MDFVRDVAAFLADNYWPRGSHVSAQERENSTATLSALNQRYGLELTGIASSRVREGRRDFYRDRMLLLNYVFTPNMIPALARLYADRLADLLAENAGRQSRVLDGREARLREQDAVALLRYYARYSQAVGLALRSCLENSSMQEAMRLVNRAEDVNFEANGQMLEARSRLEMARDKGDREVIRLAAGVLSSAEQRYRDTLLELRQARERVAGLLSQGQTGIVDHDGLVFIASWVVRRGPRAGQSLDAAASAAEYLGEVLLEKAGELEGRGGEGGRTGR
jgi:hypothetical protein